MSINLIRDDINYNNDCSIGDSSMKWCILRVHDPYNYKYICMPDASHS